MKSKLFHIFKISPFNFLPKNCFAQVKRKRYSSSTPIYTVLDGLKFSQVHAVANFDENIDITLMFFILKFLL